MDFDPAKDAANIAKHGVSLARAADLDLRLVITDDRHDYGEARFRGFGLIDGQPFCVAFTVRAGAVRPISLRRAHRKEFERYVGQ